MSEIDPRERLSMLSHDRWVLDTLLLSAPDYLVAADELLTNLGHLVRAQETGSVPERVVRHRLANHVVNDVHEVIFASLRGSGRSMMRSARSLFEAAVSCSDVLSSPDLTARYLAHEAVADRARAGLVRLDRHLSAGTRRGMNHRRKKAVRDAESEIHTAVKRWGPGWILSWAGSTLRDRAFSAGLEQDYDSFYRFASMPVHASSGGLFGTMHDDIGGSVVNRLGPSLQGCPIALIYSLAYTRIATERLGPRPEVDALLEATAGVEAQAALYGYVMSWLDEELWPKAAPPGRVAVLSVQLGQRRWLCHDPIMRRVVEAMAPTAPLPSKQEANIESCIRENAAGPLSVDEPLLIAVLGVVVTPKPGARWVDERLRLPRPPLLAPAPVPTWTPALSALGKTPWQAGLAPTRDVRPR